MLCLKIWEVSMGIRIARLLIGATIMLWMLSLVGCPTHASIADITRDPGKFAGKEVTISGQASNTFGGFGNGFFEVDDGTGRIWVLSQNFGVPGNGSKVSVTGQVQQGVSFAGKSYGVVLRQTQARD
jgi:hypothetical protein